MAQIHGLVTHRQTIQEMVGYSSVIERIVTWPIMLILKVFRISLPNVSSDHPPVDRLSDLEVTEAEFPRTAQQKIEPLLAGLAELGFEPALRYAVHLPNQQTELYQVYLRHRSGKMIAQITYRHWYQQGRQRLFTSFLSAEKSGQAVLTTNGRLDSLLWPKIHVVRKVDEPIDQLLERHEQAVQTQGFSPLHITSDVQIREIVEHLHEKNRQYQLERGTYAPLRADSPQAERLAELPPRKPPADTGSGEIDEFLVDEVEFEEVDSEPVQDGVTREIVRLMEAEAVKSTSWTQNILLLLVSLGVFIAVSRGQNDWSWTLLLIPVLLIHELGHLLVMRACGYRNTKIFFIPFFGAAASGINFNVPGWKRILVALAGPLPGLAFGGLAGVAGVMYQQPLLIKFGVISGILNLFNLLPVLPLDGGWVAFHILFCRHPLLDAAFRTCGALAMGLLAIVTRQVALGILAFFILMGAIRAFKIGDVARRLREEGIKPASEDDPGIDHALAVRVASGIRRAFASTPKLTTQVLSAAALEAYSLLHARPPRLLGSLFFGAVHFGSFFAGAVGLIVLIVGERVNLREFIQAAARQPQFAYPCGSAEHWAGAEQHTLGLKETALIVAQFDDPHLAHQQFGKLQAELSPTSRLTTFGPYVFLATPESDEELRERQIQRLTDAQAQVSVTLGDQPASSARLVTVAPSENIAESIEQELKEFSGLGDVGGLVPPWAPVWQANGPEIAAYRKARKTFLAAGEAEQQHPPIDPDKLADLTKRSREANRLGRREQGRQLTQQINELYQEARAEALQRLLQNPDESLDRDCLELYAAWKKDLESAWKERDPEDDEADVNAWQNLESYKRLRARLGTIAEDDVELARLGMRSMHVKRISMVLEFNWLQFNSVDAGLPALADWLCGQQCAQTKFEVQGNAFLFDE